MKYHIFTVQERAMLSKSKHVTKITDHTVSFTKEFKEFAIKENVEKGRRPQDIFITSGIPVSIIGNDIPQRCLGAWRKTAKERGTGTLFEDRRLKNKGAGRKKKERIDESKMSHKDLLEYYKTRSEYLDKENDFLARTRGIPRMEPFVYRPGLNTVS